MSYYGLHHDGLRRSGWDRLLNLQMSGCELAVCVGGALLVGFIAAMAGGAFG